MQQIVGIDVAIIIVDVNIRPINLVCSLILALPSMMISNPIFTLVIIELLLDLVYS